MTFQDPCPTSDHLAVHQTCISHARGPCLPTGPMEGDAFAEFVTTNREPRVVILNDESFEHLTQAATGATTGDWMVML